MAQSLEVNIRTTSDVPQAMNKAKDATVSFSKQVEDVQKKFSTAFKDIFLGFLAPMVILNTAISMIRDNIEEARRLAKEGIDLIAKGEAMGTSKEEVTLANIQKTKQEAAEKKKQTEEGQKFLLNWFVSNTKEGKQFALAAAQDMLTPEGAPSFVEKIGGYDKLLKMYLGSPEGKADIGEVATTEKPTTFKSPEGFSNVIGVGANPVMEAMTLQLEEAKKQTALLEQIAGPTTAADGWLSKGDKVK